MSARHGRVRLDAPRELRVQAGRERIAARVGRPCEEEEWEEEEWEEEEWEEEEHDGGWAQRTHDAVGVVAVV